MDYEIILFIAGSGLIFISLYLTYRANQSEDSYYLESELLSEFRELKKELNQELKAGNFNQLLEKNQKTATATKELQLVQNDISELKEQLGGVEEKLGQLDQRLRMASIATSSQQTESEPEDPGFKPEEYREIKKLVEEEGLSLTETAQQLDMGNREVDLIWKLNQRGEE